MFDSLPLEWDWNGIGMLEWDWCHECIETELVLFQREFIDRNSTCVTCESRHLEARWAHSQPSKWLGLSMGLRPSILGKSWDNPPFLRFELQITMNNLSIAKILNLSVSTVSSCPCQLLSVTVSLCLPYFRFALTKKSGTVSQFPVDTKWRLMPFSSWPPLWSGPSNASEFNISPETSEGLENPWTLIWKCGKWMNINMNINMKMNEHEYENDRKI